MYLIEDIARPVSATQPEGRDLDQTGELLELESMAKPVLPTNAEGKRITDDFSEQEPDWLKLERRCEELLKTTRDLRVAAFYSAALLRGHGLPGLAHGLDLIRQMMLTSEYRVFPQIGAGDNAVLLERWYTLVALSAPFKQEADLLRIIEGVRKLPLTRTKSSPCTYQEVIAARGQAGGVDTATLERIRSEWNQVPAVERAEMGTALTSALGAVAEIEAALLAQTPYEIVPIGAGTSPLEGLATELRGLSEFLNGPVAQQKAVAVPGVAAVEVHTAVPGEIGSRADAIRLLQQVAEFFRKTEPASPVPYFVDRAVRLVDRDFMGLLGDLVPDAVPKFQSLAGVEEKSP